GSRDARLEGASRRLALLHGQDRVGAFAFSEEEVLAVEQISGREAAGDLGGAHVVHVDATAFDVLSRLALRRAQARLNEHVDQARSGALERGARKLLGWHLPHNVPEHGLAHALEAAAKEDLARADGVRARALTVHDRRDRTGERLLRGTCSRVRLLLRLEVLDFSAGEERELLQVRYDHHVLRVHEELVELVRARARRIEPDGAALGFAELRAVALRDEREGPAPRGHAEFLSNQLGPGGDVAPLIAATDLQFAVLRAAQVIKVVLLKQLVAELGVADPRIALHARTHGFAGNHLVDREVLSDVAQEIQETQGAGPLGVVDQPRGIGCRLEIQQARQ